jgi:small subunit ribosomal protein S9
MSKKKSEDLYVWGTGRRKTAVARVRLQDGGTGKITVNRRDLEKYFGTINERREVSAPLRAIDAEKRFDIAVTARGGGFAAQADAISLGIARALVKANPVHEPVLRDGKFLTRDSREVERKKAGRSGARRSFQFSKR